MMDDGQGVGDRSSVTDEDVEMSTNAPVSGMGIGRRFDRLVTRLMQGGVVPFLGAGVSRNAVSVEAHEDHGFRPTIEWMRARLLEFTWPTKPAGHAEEDLPSEARLMLCGQGAPVSFDRLCEVLVWYQGYLSITKALKIEWFCGLCTLPAHRYLARLAREGLIEEVITTNYDTCVEDAWRYTLPEEEREKYQRCQRSDGSVPPAVIYDRSSHSLLSGKKIDELGRPLLHIYKINGCARAYRKVVGPPEPGSDEFRTTDRSPDLEKEDRDASATDEKKETDRGSSGKQTGRRMTEDEAARRIILTERQLQSFRGERWAQDLLRDRGRSRSLLFSGFGSDEPQIRRTMLDLIQEFDESEPDRESEDDGREDKVNAVWSRPNAPFVAAYDDRLSYAQGQLITTFWDTFRPDGREPPGRGLKLESANVFLGRDAPHFGAKQGATNLSADCFWKGLFLAAMGKLVRRHSEPGTPFYAWLSALTPAPRAARHAFLQWLCPGAVPPPVERLERGHSAPFPGVQTFLWSEVTEGDCTGKDTGSNGSSDDPTQNLVMVRTCYWLAVIQGLPLPRNKCAWKNDYYLPFREDALLNLSTLYVLWHLVDRAASPETPLAWLPSMRRAEGLGLAVQVGADSSNWPRVALNLVTESHLPPSEWTSKTGPGRQIRQLVLPSQKFDPGPTLVRSPSHEDQGTRSPKSRTPKLRRLHIARVVRVSAAEFLKELPWNSMPGAKELEIAFTTAFAKCVSVRHRARLVPLRQRRSHAK